MNRLKYSLLFQGIETIVIRYQTMVATVKKKAYDLLDHRKGEVQ